MITPEQLAWLITIAASFAAGALVVSLYGHYRREAAEDCPIPGCARWWPREDEGRTVYGLDPATPGSDVALVGHFTGLLDTLEAPWLANSAQFKSKPPTDITGADAWGGRFTAEPLDPDRPIVEQLRERAYERASAPHLFVTGVPLSEDWRLHLAGHECDDPNCYGFGGNR